MGRPIHKKYFGNRNIGSGSTTADDGIGGSRVASVTITSQGSYTVRPTVSFSPPDLTGAGAVQATGTVNMEGNTVAVTAGQGGTNYVVGDLLTITGAGGAIAYVATVDGVTGEALTVNFTGTGAARGNQTVLTGITSAVATTTNSVAGAGAQVDVTYRVKSITMTEKGSGYTDAADAAVSFNAGTAAGTAVLEVDSGNPGDVGYNENAISISAYVTGGSSKAGDIVAQKASRRYLVETADGTEVCKLVAAAPAAGEMTMTAIDSAGGTYYVLKLTAHRALIVKGDRTGVEFTTGADGISVPWVLGTSATLNETVEILSS